MAVAFSTGGSGYTRSDFMISDAAIPARVEEAAKADQKEQFSKVLSGIGSSRNASNASNASNTSGAGSANNAVSEKETPARYEKFEMLRSELTKSDGSLDLRKVVAAIADGKLTFADIPQEYITKALLAELINTVENVDNAKSDKDGDSEQINDPAVQQVMTELAAMMNQTAIPDDISDLSDEISALTTRITGADEVQTEQPAVQQNVPEQAVQTVQNQAAEQAEATGEAVEFTVKPETEQKPRHKQSPFRKSSPKRSRRQSRPLKTPAHRARLRLTQVSQVSRTARLRFRQLRRDRPSRHRRMTLSSAAMFAALRSERLRSRRKLRSRSRRRSLQTTRRSAAG